MNPFIPSQLDESSLTPVQFRVLCHLWRRGETYSNAATIAKTCHIKRNTVFKTIKELEEAGLIARESRKGLTTLIQPVPFKNTGVNDNLSPLGIQEVSRLGIRHPSPLGIHKGSPTKAIPLRQSQDVVLPFNSEPFQTAWNEWQKYRSEKKKKLTPTTVKMQLSKLNDMGEANAIMAINESITNGWIGLFEPKGIKNQNPRSTNEKLNYQKNGQQFRPFD